MPRAAGSSSHYTLALLDRSSEDERVTDRRFFFPSVTTIIGAVGRALAGPPAEWGWWVATEGFGILGQDAEQLRKDLKDAGQTPWDIRDEGAARGTRIHNLFEYVAKHHDGETWPVRRPIDGDGTPVEPWDGYSGAVLDWWSTTRPRLVASELFLISFLHRFSGTCDLIYRDAEDALVLCDLKTHKPASKKEPSRYTDRLQLAAYRLAWNEENPSEEIDKTMVLVAQEDGTWAEDWKEAQASEFLMVKHLYERMKGGK
jgi:hypothetical protein